MNTLPNAGFLLFNVYLRLNEFDIELRKSRCCRITEGRVDTLPIAGIRLFDEKLSCYGLLNGNHDILIVSGLRL